MKLLIKFPTRGRKEKFFEVLNKYYEYLENLDNTKFLITCDNDDLTMNNDEVKKLFNTYKNLEVIYGVSKTKVDAVNRDMDKSGEYDIILLASDDMIPQIHGYDNIVREKMKEYYPDTDGVLWFSDGYQKNKLNTLCILGKKYYERFDYIYQPNYKSCWCDNEFMEVSKILNKCTYFDTIIIKHEHPDWGFGKRDKVHQLNHINFIYDRTIFQKRREIGFQL